MPTYEYRCPACDHRFEVFQRISDEPGAPCPECDTPAERVLSGGAGFLLRGEGFYITDYRSKEYREKAKAESGGDSAAASSGEPATSSGDRGTAGGSDAGSSTSAAKPSGND